MPRIQPAAARTESLSGLIERVTFFSEETGFAVLRVKVKGQRDLVTVVGNMASVSAGEWLTAEGQWIRDKEHGLQLKANLLKSSPPTTREGIEKYLASGMVKGIGPIYARKLVEKFGEKIFDVIENFSARLQEVDGIGPERRKRIKTAWAEQKFVREIMVFLHSQGVSTSQASRIYRVYGESAIEKVRANPYILAKEIHGIGFKTADRIAQNMGVPRDSLLRAEAGLAQVLADALGSGHCALPRPELIPQALRLLDTDERIITEALDRLLATRHLVQEQIEGEPLIFLPVLAAAETGIANRIKKLAAQTPSYPPINLEKAFAWAREKTGTDLAPSQRQALQQALTRQIVVITGGPGVGKTTLLKSLLLILRAKKLRCLLCAPTGRAAKRLGEATGLPAQTIHRLLQFQPGGGFARHEANPLQADLVVVDEMSMVDVPLMHALLKAHPPRAGLVLVGDVDQLPSVGPGSVLKDLIDSGIVPVVRLTEIFRQAAQSRIITAAHAINRGAAPPPPQKDEPADFYFLVREEPDAILATLLDFVKNRIPRKLKSDPIQDTQVLCPMNRGSLGVGELNLRLQTELNPAKPGEPAVDKFGWQFRIRDKIIQTENNYDKDVFNGDIGRITSIDPVEREVQIRFDDRLVSYDFADLDEITLAYAITIHKAQGSEFPAVVIPLATQQYLLLQRNLIYTGLTRGKKLVLFIGQPKALHLAIRNDRTARRYSALKARLLGA